MGQDLRYALRGLRKSPAFTLTAILSLALGIGANTAIFSLVNAFLLRPLPFGQPDRLVMLYERNVAGNETQMGLAPGNFLDWQASATSFESVSAYLTATSTLANDAGTEPERVVTCGCSANLLSTLGVSPLVGRALSAADDRFEAPGAVVISYSLWQRHFNGSPDVVGKTIRLSEQPASVVGVMPATFTFPNRAVDIWVPLLTLLPPAQQIRHDLHFLQMIGRLRANADLARARAELDGIATRYKSAHPNESTAKGATVIPLQEALVSGVRTPLLILLSAVSCVLLIACVNIANLLLTRAGGRAREIGIRFALGAGRARIVRQLITESLVLGLAGGALGVALAVWIARLLVARAPGADAVLPGGTLRLDPVVFVFATIVAVATGIAVGVVPALRGSRGEISNDLRESTRSSTAGRAHGRFRDVLVTAEVGLSLMLLVAAGLLFHSFSRVYDVHAGVRIDHTLTMGTSLPAARYPSAQRRSAFYAELADRLRSVPGVTSVGLNSCTPLTGGCNALFYYIEGRPFTPGTFLTAFERSVDPGYFTAAGIQLLRGRTFTKEDGVGFDAQHPRLGKLVISDALARTNFPNEDPIGKQIFFDFELQRQRNEGTPAPRYEVIGVVGDVVTTLDSPVRPMLYRPLLDVANGGASVLVHTAVEPTAVAASVRDEIRKLDPALVVFGVRTMEEVVGRSTSDRRFTMLLFVSFAALAVLLAAVGLYGVVSYGVSQRTTEIGIRMALGAGSGDVSRMVVMQGMRPALAGLVLGLVGAGLASRVLQTLLFGVSPIDPLTFAAVPPLLLAIAVAACYVPAWRATRVSPTIALRSE